MREGVQRKYMYFLCFPKTKSGESTESFAPCQESFNGDIFSSHQAALSLR